MRLLAQRSRLFSCCGTRFIVKTIFRIFRVGFIGEMPLYQPLWHYYQPSVVCYGFLPHNRSSSGTHRMTSASWEMSTGLGFVVRGESPGYRLISTASMLEWLRNLLPHHSQGSSTERWSRNTRRVITARVFYVPRGFLTSPFILNNSVETAAPFNVASHPRCSEPRN